MSLLDDYSESQISSAYTCITVCSVGICVTQAKLAAEGPSPRLLPDLCRPVTEWLIQVKYICWRLKRHETWQAFKVSQIQLFHVLSFPVLCLQNEISWHGQGAEWGISGHRIWPQTPRRGPLLWFSFPAIHFSLWSPCFDLGWHFKLGNILQDSLKALKLHYSTQQIPPSNCPALSFWDIFFVSQQSNCDVVIKPKFKPRHWWLVPVVECRRFAGKILKAYSQNLCGISYNDGDYPISMEGGSFLQDFHNFPATLDFFLSPSYICIIVPNLSCPEKKKREKHMFHDSEYWKTTFAIFHWEVCGT